MVLWDLDSVDPGAHAVVPVALALAGIAGRDSYQLASGHPCLVRAREAVLLRLGWVLLPARARRNGADAQLLHAAWWVRRHAGLSRFIVASCDHAFAPLAARTETTVAALRPGLVSHRLAASAQSVVPLDGVLASAAGCGSAQITDGRDRLLPGQSTVNGDVETRTTTDDGTPLTRSPSEPVRGAGGMRVPGHAARLAPQCYRKVTLGGLAPR